jgi:hypothetical protein
MKLIGRLASSLSLSLCFWMPLRSWNVNFPSYHVRHNVYLVRKTYYLRSAYRWFLGAFWFIYLQGAKLCLFKFNYN